MLYVAMSGAKQTLGTQAINSHNLANVATSGFRADLSAFRSQPVFGAGFPTRVYAVHETVGTDLSFGTIVNTGRELDVAVKGEGWIAVQTTDGGEAYTRAGSLRVNANGMLESSAGRPVLGNVGPIAIPPADRIEIGNDGTISFLPRGQEAATLAVVDRIRLVNPPHLDLEKGLDGLMRVRGGKAPPAPDAGVQLTPGSLEGSNVNAVDAMINMITLAKQFEMQVKMMETAKENAAASTQMMSVA